METSTPFPYSAQCYFLPEDWADRAARRASSPSLQAWQMYAAQANKDGALPVLRRALVQLHFPIQAGISRSDGYRAAVLRGVSPHSLPEATGLALQAPDALQITIHTGLNGPVPALVPGARADFESLVQALSARNEPRPIPPSMGAVYIRGYNNWGRLRAYRASGSSMARLGQPDPAHYQDEFIIASRSPYSGVPAGSLGMSAPTWAELSLQIRLAHESAHAFTRRVCGAMRRHLLDELAADYHALRTACGRFEPEWFLRFMGMEEYPEYRSGGRMENYLPDGAAHPPRQLLDLVFEAVRNVAAFDAQRLDGISSRAEQAAAVLAIETTSLESLAARGAVVGLLKRHRTLSKQLK